MMKLAWLSGMIGIAATAPAMAAERPVASVRVVACDAGDCLLVRGRRAAPSTVILLNARSVAVGGGRSWQVRVPVATMRRWSAPFARTLHVAMVGADGVVERDGSVRLPVGLLGGTIELASLDVRAR